ncbi:MAG: hypothetical protein Q7U10_07380 [Thermodesulfovibrionia bacterium]|nr:hypothetical protein [Thermodesulfovibrionia bacterium]
MGYMRLIFTFIIAVTVLFVSGCNTSTQPPEKSRKPIDTTVSRKLSVVSAAFLSPEMEQARQETHNSTIEFTKDGSGVVYIEPVKDKFRVVHNGKTGNPYLAISELSISSDGKRVAYVARISDSTYKMVIDSKEGLPFGANDNHWFTPDGKHHLSTVTEGDNRYIVIDNKVNHDYRMEQGLVISPDSSALAFSIKSPDGNSKQLIITDIELKNKKVFDSCGEYIVPNDDTSLLAVVCSEGGKGSVKVIDFLNRTVISDSKYDGTITHLRFSPDNRSWAYTYFKSEKQRYIVCNGREEQIPVGDEFLSEPLVLSDPESVGVIIGDVFEARLHRAFQKQNKDGKGYGYTSDFVSSKDRRHYAFIAVNHNEERQYIVVDGNEGIKFDKIVSPVFSPDGKFLVYRARQSGKRFIVISDLNGKIIRQHRYYDMVFQPIFVDDGKSVAYIVLDGNEFWWKVEKL